MKEAQFVISVRSHFFYRPTAIHENCGALVFPLKQTFMPYRSFDAIETINASVPVAVAVGIAYSLNVLLNETYTELVFAG